MRQYFSLFLLACFALASCGTEGGVKTTKLGNQYILHSNLSEGPEAKTNDYVYVHATMRTADSTMFDTRDNGGQATAIPIPPDSLGAGQVGPVEDVLRGLHAGDSVTVIVRIDTLEQRPPGLENVDELYYDIKVEEVLSKEDFDVRREAEQAEQRTQMEAVIAREAGILEFANTTLAEYKAGTLANVQETTTGLKYVIHDEGTGSQAEAGRGVTVQYMGLLVEDGTNFDQSFRRGQGIDFVLGTGRVIPGWDEGIALMKEGGSASLFIPAGLAYGASGSGSIPPGAELMFYVELEEVQ